MIAWFAARTVSVNTSAPSASLIAGARPPSSSYLPLDLRHDLAPFGERVEVLARGAAVGAGVALGEVRDRGEEVAERLERHVAHQAEVLAGADEPLLDGGVLGPLLGRELDADERHPGRRAHAVGDGLLEAVAVADAAEVREQELGDGVVAALERGREPEPLLVLREHGPAQGRTAEAVALVGDEQPAGRVGRYRLVRGRGVAGRDQHVARRSGRRVPLSPRRPIRASGSAAVSRPCHCSMSTRDGTTTSTKRPRRKRVGRGGDRDVGLARAGDRLDHAPAAAAQPAHERVELPAVELGETEA